MILQQQQQQKKKSWDMGHLLNKPDNSGDKQRVTHS